MCSLYYSNLVKSQTFYGLNMSNSNKINTKILEKAVSLLRNDDVIAVPTETVYGLAANIHNIKGILFTAQNNQLANCV